MEPYIFLYWHLIILFLFIYTLNLVSVWEYTGDWFNSQRPGEICIEGCHRWFELWIVACSLQSRANTRNNAYVLYFGKHIVQGYLAKVIHYLRRDNMVNETKRINVLRYINM